MAKQEKTGTILVVDDAFTNRALLNKIFSGEYQVEQAENGMQALETLRRNPDMAAVILDIQMPEMDGYEVLRTMRQEPQLQNIPVVVDTSSDDVESQLKALDLGAVDVLIKPFNPQIALHRVRNIIIRRETNRQSARNELLEQLLLQSELDEKTGIWNKSAFCRKTSELLQRHPERQYAIVRWDVDRFKLYNDVFGVAAGDAFLAAVGAAYRSNHFHALLYSHWEADHFVECLELSSFLSKFRAAELEDFVNSLAPDFEFVPRIGVYIVDDPSLEVSLMCDRALLALRSIKNEYSARIAYYSASMRATLLEEQELLSEMDRALSQEQFIVYLQPQYNYTTKTLHGAEVLVRWKHPSKGLIPPGKFIPIFEHNGFISKVDEYVWERACCLQRQWLDAGLPVVPVSVNISRRDIYNPHLCDIITNLVKKYQLTPDLLRLEITESAYVENAEQLIKTVKKLQAEGFAVEMDDFGSGYSSLNTLKEVPVDTLKLDMKFLDNSTEDTRGGNILTSIIRMAHWIKLPVIAEGVETKAQADYLKSVGCFYMQGYYFAKPMPVEQYETILRTSHLEDNTARHFTDDIEGAEDFLSASTQATLLFNSFVGGAAIIEYDGSNVEALRLNDKFFEALGTTRETYAGKQLRLQERFDDTNRIIFLDAIKQAVHTGKECCCELRSLPLDAQQKDSSWLQLRMRFLAKNGGHNILYMAIDDISTRMRLLGQNAKLSEQLSAIINSIPGGILHFEVTDHLHLFYFNDRTAYMFGYSRIEFNRLYSDTPLNAVHPDDLTSVQPLLDEISHGSQKILQTDYRHKCADGSWRWVRLTGQIMPRNNDTLFASCILLDIDSQVKNLQRSNKQTEQLEEQRISLQVLYDSIPCGIMQLTVAKDSGTTKLVSFNDTAWKLFGYLNRDQYIEAVHGNSKLKDIHPTDLPDVQACIEALYHSESGKQLDMDHRIVHQNGGIRWFHALFQKVCYNSGEEVVQVVFNDITERKQMDLRQINLALFRLFDEVYEFDVTQNISFKRSGPDQRDQKIGRLIPFHRHLDILCQKYAHPDDRDAIRSFYMETAYHTNVEPQTLEYRYFDDQKQLRWASATVLHLSGSTCLTCNKDITAQKTAAQLAYTDEVAQTLARARQTAEEHNRLLIEQTGALICDYNPANDVLTIQRKDSEHGIITETVLHYLAELPKNAFISMDDRECLLSTLRKALERPMHNTVHFRGRGADGNFHPYCAQLASIADQSGQIYRIIGQVNSVHHDLEQQSLSEWLPEITGSSYSDVAYQHSIVESVRSILSHSTDIHAAVQSAIAEIGKQLEISCVYVMETLDDTSHLEHTFVWCNEGITLHTDLLKDSFPPADSQKELLHLFHAGEGVIACSDISALPQWMRNQLDAQGIQSILCCALTEEKPFRGWISFAECHRTRNWTKEQMDALRVVSQVIGAFLFQNHSKQDVTSPHILDLMNHSPAYCYVIDPDTYEVLYANDTVVQNYGSAVTDILCYELFAGSGTVCPTCPIKMWKEAGLSIPVNTTCKTGTPCLMYAFPLLWHGKKAFALFSIDADCFAQDPAASRDAAYRNDLARYTQTLASLYDEILELDFGRNRFLTHSTNYRYQTKPMTLSSAIDFWITNHVAAEHQTAVRNFLTLRNIQEEFEHGHTPSLRYALRFGTDSTRIYFSTLLRLDGVRFLCCNKDITKEKQAKQLQQEIAALQTQTEAQDLYRIIVEQAGTAVIEMNYETGQFHCSEAYYKYEISRHSQELLFSNQSDRRMIHPDDQKILERFFTAKDFGESQSAVVLRVLMTDGTYRWTRMAGTYLRDKQGKLLRSIGTFTDLDEEMRSKIALQQISNRMHHILESIPTGLAIYKVGEQILPVYISDKTCELFGFTRREYDLRIANGEPIYFMPNITRLSPERKKAALAGQQITIPKLQAQRKDGSRFWLRAFCRLSQDAEGTILCYAVLADISDEIARQHDYDRQVEKYRILMEDSGNISFDYSTEEDTLYLTILRPGKGLETEQFTHYLATLPNNSHIAHAKQNSFIHVLQKARTAAGRGSYDFQGDFYKSGMRWYRARYVSLADEEGTVYSVLGRLDDIDDFVQERNHLREHAQIDEITGIYNKNYAMSAIADALKKKPTNGLDAILFLDIDNFKKINDLYGHIEADKVLSQIGTILRYLFRKSDIIARFGGDEFVVYLRSADTTELVATKAAELIRRINAIRIGSETPVGCSIGIALIRKTGISYENALKCANTALYLVKQQGKNQYILRECEDHN